MDPGRLRNSLDALRMKSSVMRLASRTVTVTKSQRLLQSRRNQKVTELLLKMLNIMDLKLQTQSCVDQFMKLFYFKCLISGQQTPYKVLPPKEKFGRVPVQSQICFMLLSYPNCQPESSVKENRKSVVGEAICSGLKAPNSQKSSSLYSY